MHILTRSLTNSKYSTYLILFYKYQVSCFVFLHMQKLLPSPLSPLFVLNSDCHQCLTTKKDNLHLHTHRYSFSLRVQVLKFGMTFLSHFVIHLLFLVTNINWEIIFNHKFKLSWTQIFFSLQTLFFITFCTLSLIAMFISLYMQ